MSILGYLLPAASVGVGSLLIRPKRGFFPVLLPDQQGPPSPGLIPQITLEEIHTDELQITDHPVEQGAVISDHAFKRPAQVIITCAWSNTPNKASSILSQAVGVGAALGGSAVRTAIGIGQTVLGGGITAAQSILKGNAPAQIVDVYKKMLALQESRIPFDIYTGKRSYKNMLFASLAVTTSAETENTLIIQATCRQVIIVTTQVIQVPINSSAQKQPEKTTPTQNTGPQQPTPAPAFTPGADTVTGAVNQLASSVSSVSTIFSSLPASLPGVGDFVGLAGPLGQLPSVMGQCTEALAAVSTNLPIPLEIPTIAASQAFSIPLASTMTEELSGALNSLPSILGSAQTSIAAALQQLPSALPSLPDAFGALPDLLKGMQASIPNVLAQASDVLSRASVIPADATNQMSVLWNDAQQVWNANIFSSGGAPVVTGVPLVAGANLVEQFGHLGFAGQFRAGTPGSDAPPTFANLGAAAKLYFVGP